MVVNMSSDGIDIRFELLLRADPWLVHYVIKMYVISSRQRNLVTPDSGSGFLGIPPYHNTRAASRSDHVEITGLDYSAQDTRCSWW